jgi:methyl-accepting chemotaxis protein
MTVLPGDVLPLPARMLTKAQREACHGYVGEINEITTAIASAIEQQSAAKREISASVQQAARGTDDVTTRIAAVTHAAGETAPSAT